MSLSLFAHINAQGNKVVLEDDEYNFSLITQAVMTLKLDTVKGETEVPYRVYDGSLVDDQDTLYYRVDLWENPGEIGIDSSIVFAESMLDTTLTQVEGMLRGKRIYVESTFRNGWPARLARFDVPSIQRMAKVLLVRRFGRYYLLTVVSSPGSQHHTSVNRFIHSFRLYE